MPTSKVEKTVYILGAGFSAPAGGPDQAKLIERIFKLPDTDATIRDAKEALEDFLVNIMCVDIAKKSEVNLEDIYTPIDRCLADGVSLRDMTPYKLQELRSKIEFLISLSIDGSFREQKVKDANCQDYVARYAEYLVNIASKRSEKAIGSASAKEAKSYDPFSIISLNWDIVLDKALFEALVSKDGNVDGDYEPFGVVDYCCYISSIEEREKRIRTGLWSLGARGYNIKLLKIHGSMNWLQCSHCQQLFVSFDEKINIPNFIKVEKCRRCSKYDVDAPLQGSLVMPTFLKDLSNFQIKLVWQNAAVELMEADRIVFIGYSLPHADFEFRQLLSRMIRKDAQIDVNLYHDGSAEAIRQYDEECKRYLQFFGARKVTLNPDGVISFVNKLTATRSL